MKDEEVIKTIREINADIYDQTQSEYIRMEYRSDGMTNAVMFLGQCIWNDDDDMREYIDDGYTKEPLIDFLTREAKEEVQKLTSLWPTPKVSHRANDMKTQQQNQPTRAEAHPVGSTCLVGADEDLHAAYLMGYHKRDREIRGLRKAVERLQTDMRIIATWARNDATSGEMRYRAMRDIENRAEESLRASTIQR